MMMGFGFLFMLVIGLVVIGIPLLIIAFILGWLPGLLKSQPRQVGQQTSQPSYTPASSKNCPSCGRSVKVDWNVCPSCGAALV